MRSARSAIAHIDSDFGENACCCISCNTWHRASQFNLPLVGLRFLLNFLIQFFDHVFDKLHVFESLPDQKAVVVAQAMSFQGFNDLWNFRA